MTYEARHAEQARDGQYAGLKQRTAQVKSHVEAWMNDATALHTNSPAGDQPDIIAMRDQLVADLRTILGV